jgi:hypothetical protein
MRLRALEIGPEVECHVRRALMTANVAFAAAAAPKVTFAANAS